MCVSNPYIKQEVTFILLITDPVIKHKTDLLNLAEEFSNQQIQSKDKGIKTSLD